MGFLKADIPTAMSDKITLNMDLVNRLRHYMDKSQVTISQFADRCGIPRPTMSQLMNGRNKRISDEVITKIHNAFPELSILWLMFGEGDMTPTSNIEISEPQNQASTSTDLSQRAVIQPNNQCSNPAASFAESISTGNNLENMLFESPNTEDSAIPYETPHDEGTARENILFDTAPSESLSPASSSSSPTSPIVNPQPQQQRPPFSNDITRTLGINQPSPFRPSSTREPSQIEDSNVKHISISPDAHKKITNIVVFYSDNSFQSFLPDA